MFIRIITVTILNLFKDYCLAKIFMSNSMSGFIWWTKLLQSGGTTIQSRRAWYQVVLAHKMDWSKILWKGSYLYLSDTNAFIIMFYDMNEISSHSSYIGNEDIAKIMEKCIDVEQTLKHYLGQWHLQHLTAMLFLNEKGRSKRR